MTERRPFTLVLAMRSRLFGAFKDLQRQPIPWAEPDSTANARRA
ncbi:MAG: hypothetical protein QM674_21505 [Burkholderiaceae bacterium]